MDDPLHPVAPLTLCAWRLGELGLEALSWRCVELGSKLDSDDLASYLLGETSWPPVERLFLRVALNEHLWELGLPSVAAVPLENQLC